MKIKSRGIILHTTNYSETSLVVKIYTEQCGMGSFIVSGVRSQKSRFSSSIFQPLTLVEVLAAAKPGQTMHRITDIHLSPPFSGIPGNLIKSTIAIFLSEIIYRSVREEEINNPLFNFLHNGIQILDLSHENCGRFHIYFMVQLSRYLGFFPNGEYLPAQSYFDLREGLFRSDIPAHAEFLDKDQSSILFALMNKTFDDYHDVQIPQKISRSLLQALVSYFEIHQTHGNQIRSHKILEEVLS